MAHTPSNQHYTTKAHLDKFIHPSVGQQILYPYRKGGNRHEFGPRQSACKPRGTRRLGSAINFYTQRINGELSDQLDRARGELEDRLFASGRANPGVISQCIYDDGFVPRSQGEKLLLCSAAALLRCGSPVQIHNTAMIGLFCIQADALNRLNTDEARSLYQQHFGDQAEAQLEHDRQELLNGDLIVDVGDENRKQFGFESFNYQRLWIDALMEMELALVSCQANGFFVTSDNPVVLSSNVQKDNPGLALRDAEVWFPLSYSKGLLWRRSGVGVPRMVLSDRETLALNKKMVKWCYKFVYSPLPADWLENAARSETFNSLFGHYGNLATMIENARPLIDANNNQQIGEAMEIMSGLRQGRQEDILRI